MHLSVLSRHPSATLLIVQLLGLLAYPFLGGSAPGKAALGVVGMVMVLVAIWAVRFSPALVWVALLFGGPALVFTFVEAWSPGTDWVVLTNAALHAPTIMIGEKAAAMISESRAA